MLELRQQRSAEGKATHFELNGRHIDLDKYLKRTRVSPKSLVETGPLEVRELPQYVRSRTPPTIASSLGSSDVIRVRELVLAYYTSLPSSESSLLPRPGHPHLMHIGGTIQLFEQLFRASWLFNEQHHSEAGIMTRDAFLHLETLHQSSFPQFLLFVLYASTMYPINNGILLQLWKYLAARSTVLEEPTSIRRQLATLVYRLLRTSRSGPAPYFQLMPELMEKVIELDTDRRALTLNAVVLGSLKMKMNKDIKRTPETRSLIQRCIDRGLLLVADPGIKQSLEAYASSLELEDYDQWQPPPYRRRYTDREHSPKPSLSEWLYYSSLARVEKRRCSEQILHGNPRHDLACYHLERSISLWLSESAPEPHVIMDLRMLETWCREGGDILRAEAARERCGAELTRMMCSRVVD